MSSKNMSNAARLIARASLHADLEDAEAKVKRLKRDLQSIEKDLKDAEADVTRLKKRIEESEGEAGEAQASAPTLDPGKIYARHNSRFRG